MLEIATRPCHHGLAPGVDGALWHFDFRGPDEERLVQGREHIYLDRFWKVLSGDPKRIDEIRGSTLLPCTHGRMRCTMPSTNLGHSAKTPPTTRRCSPRVPRSPCRFLARKSGREVQLVQHTLQRFSCCSHYIEESSTHRPERCGPARSESSNVLQSLDLELSRNKDCIWPRLPGSLWR